MKHTLLSGIKAVHVALPYMRDSVQKPFKKFLSVSGALFFKKDLYFRKGIFNLSANRVPESSLELSTHKLRHSQWHQESHRLEIINSYGSNQEPSEIKVQLV